MKVGIIGFGHLARAFASGVIDKKVLPGSDIYISSKTQATKDYALETFGIESYPTNTELVENCDLIILSVKPVDSAGVLAEIGSVLGNKLLLSFVAGLRLDLQGENLEEGAKLVRVFPNVAMGVGESLTTYAANDQIGPGDVSIVEELFGKIGTLLEVTEDEMDSIGALSSSGIAFAAYVLNSFAQAGKTIDIPEKYLKTVVNQTFAGAIAMTQGDMSPVELMESVATEGGSTIEGLKTLKTQEVEEKIIQSVQATNAKMRNMLGGK